MFKFISLKKSKTVQSSLREKRQESIRKALPNAVL